MPLTAWNKKIYKTIAIFILNGNNIPALRQIMRQTQIKNEFDP